MHHPIDMVFKRPQTGPRDTPRSLTTISSLCALSIQHVGLYVTSDGVTAVEAYHHTRNNNISSINTYQICQYLHEPCHGQKIDKLVDSMLCYTFHYHVSLIT